MKKFEHGGNIYGADRPAEGWLDFSANINPLGLTADVRNAIIGNVDNLVHYPDPEGEELRQAISDYYGSSSDNIILGNGAVELLYIFFHCYRPSRVIIPVPSFNEYERSAVSCGAEVEYYPLPSEKEYMLDLDELLMYLSSLVQYNGGNGDRLAVILGNPNNPTGQLLPADKVRQFVCAAEKLGIDVMVDESFLDFRKDRNSYSVAGLVNQYNNLLVLQSMTKFYAIPGLRLGFALANKGMVQAMNMAKDPWNVNLLAQKAGIAALAANSYQEASRAIIEQESSYVYEEIPKIADKQGRTGILKPYTPTVNFCMIELGSAGITSRELTSRMRSKGVLIRDCSNYPGLDDYHIRVAIRGHSENNRMLNALQEVLRW